MCHPFCMQTLRSIRALSLVLSVLVSASIAQQTPGTASSAAPASPTISVKVKEVNLLAIVRDKKGQPVNSLHQQDFVLEQDGRAQTIAQFAPQSDSPLTFGVLADTGPGQRKALADERKASTGFVNRLLRESKDKAFVLHFDKEVELLQDVTTQHDKVAKGIDQISVGEAPRNSGNGRKRDEEDREHPHYFFGGTMLYDAIFLSADEVLKNRQGRKAVVLFSDGADRGSKTSIDNAIQSAQRADTLVYCVYVESEHDQSERGAGDGQRRGGGGGGSPFPGGGGGPFPGGGSPFPGGGGRRRQPENVPHEDKNAGKKILQRISKETGGRYFELSKKLTAAQIYAQIEEEMRHQYSLSYTPDKAEDGYHKLHLSTRNADLTVQTREGFYAE
jgi:VWFA-related protein